MPSRGGSRVRFKTPSVPRVPWTEAANLSDANRLYPNYRHRTSRDMSLLYV